MKRNIWFITIILLVMAGCSAQQKQSVVKRKFYTPSGWQKPIAKSSVIENKESIPVNKPVVSETKKKFKPVFNQGTTQVTKQERTPFKPKFDNTKSPVKTSPVNKVKPPVESADFVQPASTANTEQMVGYASWYGPGFHGKKAASGEQYNQNKLTAAHKILPMDTWVRVKNLENNQTVVVRINDRGPYKKNRIIDLTRRAATDLGFVDQGTARVSIKVLKYPKNYDPRKGLEPYKQVVVQLAVFRGEDRAKSFLEQLASKYSQIKFKIDDHKEKAYHVIAGPYKERSKAVKVAKDLRSDGIDNFVRSYRK
jgi:rare lipoprotein A